jgi:hypothetical protein
MFVAHTGLEQLATPLDLWRGLPMRSEVRMTWWSVPSEEIPTGERERVLWLYEWWEKVDTWIERHRVPQVPAGPFGPPESGQAAG